MNLELLKHFGCSINDIHVYKSLIGRGVCKTGAVIQDSGIVSSRVYESLRRLIAKGLVSYQVKNNVRYYRAELPDKMVVEFEQYTQSLRDLSVQIANLPAAKADRNETNVYEGFHGFEMAFLKHVENISKDEHVGVIAFSNHTVTKGGFSRTKKLFAEVDEIIFSKTKNVHILIDKKLESMFNSERVYHKKYIKKFLPSEYFSPTAINISDKEVLLSVWGDKPIVFSIKNPIVVSSFKKNFELLWGIAKGV